MSLDADPTRISKTGTVTVDATGAQVSGFEGENCSCRELVVLALSWAIGELQKELQATIERPGGTGRTGIE